MRLRRTGGRIQRFAAGLVLMTMLLPLLWVGTGRAETGVSDSGLVWTSRQSGSKQWFHGIAQGGGVVVVVGDGGAVLTSADGTSWTSRSSGVSANLIDVAYGGGRFVAVGSQGTILTSGNGAAWSRRPLDLPHQLNGVVYGQGRFVAVGNAGTLLHSADGEAWTAATGIPDEKLYDVTYGNGLFVAVGYGGTILTSTDGRSWAPQSSGVGVYLSGVAFGGGRFLAVGESDTVLSSPDGKRWSLQKPAGLGAFGLWSVAYGNGQFTAVGGIGNILSTTDGSAWVQHDTKQSFAFMEDVEYVGGQFVAVGSEGTIRTSGAAALKPATAEPAAPTPVTPTPEAPKPAAPLPPTTCEAGKVVGPRTERQIGGGLVIKADAASVSKDGKEELCGNITLNDVLKLDGRIQVNPADLSMSGEGRLYMETGLPYYHGAIELFEGKFKLDGDLTDIIKENGVDRLKIADLHVKIVKLRLIQDGLVVSGELALPAFAGGKPVKFDGLRIVRGQIEAFEVAFPEIKLGTTQMMLKHGKAKFDAAKNLLEGQGMLIIPRMLDIEGALGVKNGRLDRVEFGLSGLKLPIDGSGFYITRIHGGVSGLTDMTNLRITAGTAITGGPQIDGMAVMKAENLQLVVDVSGFVRGSGTIKLVEVVKLEGALEWNWAEKYVAVEAELNAFDIITANADIKVHGADRFYGDFKAAFKIPDAVPFVGGDHVGAVDAHVDNSGLAAGAKLANLVKIKCTVNWEGATDCDWSLRKLWGWAGMLPVVASADTVVAAPPEGEFIIPPGHDNVIVALNWDAGDADFAITTPSGKVITPADAPLTSSAYRYKKHDGRREAYYLIVNPEPGRWRYSVTARGATAYELELVGIDPEPVLSISSPAADQVSTGTVRVTWQATAPTGSKLNLYYTMAADELGTQFASSLDPTVGSFVWDTTALPSGTYYIYGQLESDGSMPVKAVAAGKVTVTNRNAPGRVQGLTVKAVNGTLEVAWAPNTEPDVAGYRVYLVGTGDTAVLGRETQYTWKGLEPNRTYQVAVAAYDEDWLEGEWSTPVSVQLPVAVPPAIAVTWPAAVTNQEVVRVEGQIDAGATGTLYLNDQVMAGQLTGTFSKGIALDPGNNRLRLVVVKPGGDAAEQEHEVYYDRIRPQLTVNDLYSTMSVATSAIRISGTVEPTASLTLNGRPVQVSADGQYATTLSLVKGENRVELVARDAAGNQTIFQGVITSTDAATACGALFPDVGAAHPACSAVEQLAGMDVIKGYPDGSFQPDKVVTRAEFAKMLVVALGRAPRPQAQLSFRDVSGHWAASGGYLQTAVDLQAIAGFPDGTFKPDDSVTRAQVVKIVAAAAGLSPAGRAPYADVPAGAWYEGWAGVAFKAGYIGSGAPVAVWTGSTLQGDKPATRAEAAIVLANLLNAGR